MAEPIVTRELIAAQAELAARALAAGEVAAVPNPYPPHSDAAAAFQASLERWVQAVAAPEGEASA